MMKIKPRLILTALGLLLAVSVFGEGEQYQTREEPNTHQHKYSNLQTYLEDDPIRLVDLEDRILKVYVRGGDLDVRDIDLSTVLVQGKIPPYTAARIEGNQLVTDVFIFRFLAAWRPICEDIQGTYSISFDLKNEEHITLYGELHLDYVQGDVNLDGLVNGDDIAFFEDYLYNSGPGSMLEEALNVNCDRYLNLDDLELLKQLVAEAEESEPNREKQGYGDPPTYLEQNPIVLKDLTDRILRVYVRGTNFDIHDIDLSTVVTQGKIPPYTEARIEGDRMVTDVFIFRFLSAWRPIEDDVHSRYTVEFDLNSGEHIVLDGTVNVKIYPGDLNFEEDDCEMLFMLLELAEQGVIDIDVEELERMLEEAGCYEEEEPPYRRRDRDGKPFTYLEEDPVTLVNLPEKLLKVYVRRADYALKDIVLESVLINGKIPPHTEAWIEEDRLITDVLLMRFMTFCRPIEQDVHAGYSVSFDLTNGEHVDLYGEVNIEYIEGDLNLDGTVNIEDIVFIIDYLHHSGPSCVLEEMLDVDNDGIICDRDILAVTQIVY
ncbi:MAG: dockerin type I domain-containing protein [Candidatus Zixiibacteriota bacterium]